MLASREHNTSYVVVFYLKIPLSQIINILFLSIILAAENVPNGKQENKKVR
jgi:hypothetical protein